MAFPNDFEDFNIEQLEELRHRISDEQQIRTHMRLIMAGHDQADAPLATSHWRKCRAEAAGRVFDSSKQWRFD